MTTLDKTAREAAYTAWDAFDGTSTRYQIDDAIRAYLDALSSLPAQAVDVPTPQRWRDVGYLMACIDDAIEQGYDPDVDGPLLDEIRAELKAPPSQPAAVGIADEMVEIAARAIFETWAKTEGSTMTWADAVAACETPDAFPKMSKIVPLCRSEARAALEAALVHRDQVKL